MRGMPKGQGYAKEYALRCKASLSGVDGNWHQGCDQVSKNIDLDSDKDAYQGWTIWENVHC